MATYRRILVIPDSHVEPGQSNVRAEWLGRLIEDKGPTDIIHIGDLAEMGSMSSYEKFKGSGFLEDCEACYDFQDKLTTAAGSAWDDATSVFLEGNHEARIRKFVKDYPELEGTIGLKDLGVHEYFDKVVEWKGGPCVYNRGGIMFAHYVQNRMGRALGGVHHARSLLLNCMQSVVVGHSHCLNYHSLPLPSGKHIHGLVCGCFFDHKHDWAGQSNEKYWRGIALLHDVKDGNFDLEMISMHRIKRDYK